MPSATTPALPIWNRFVRFIGEDGNKYCGEPVDSELDVGLAMEQNEPVMVKLLSGTSALDCNTVFTGEVVRAREILTPITPIEAGTIRCIGLNYTDHAAEMKLALPTNPEVFFKPSTCLNGPSSPIHLPPLAASSADLEVELAVVLGEDVKDASAVDAMHTGVKARAARSERIKVEDIAEIIAYLSVGTTLMKGTVILTGTPCGIGHSYKPPVYLAEGDKMKIWISHGLGTLTNPIVLE
ncbi:hypothetical protein V494_00006 [Pseudogymnoascus sp. VKM F-4513 (FW-928)]|nr:hypothetical protein V494_00006 [Pseudogymnoascus sp. VKM F-4513 (FW-928)]